MIVAPAAVRGRADLRTATARGAALTGLAFVANKGVVLGASVVLARVLTARELGVVAIALLVVGWVERISEGGLESAIVVHPGPDEECLDNGLGLSLVLGTGCLVVGVVTAPLIAVAFGEPDLGPVLAALSLLYLTTSVRLVLAGGLARRMQFGRRLWPELIRAATKAAVMIGLALAGWGIWALTLGHLFGALVGVAAYAVALRHRLRPRLSADVARPLLRFGGTVSAVAVVGAVVQNADYVMLGLRADAAAVGVYSIGFRIPELTVLAVPVVASHSLIAGYAQVAASPGSIGRAYLAGLGALAAALVPLGVGLSLVADDAIALLFGPGWEAAVPVLSRVGLYAVAFGLGFPLGDALKATGRASLLLRIGLARAVVTLPLLWLAAGRGLAAVATVHVAVAVGFVAVAAVIARHALDASLRAQLRAVAAPVVATGLLALAVVAVRSGLSPGPLRLLAAISAGGAAYVASLAALDRRALDAVRAALPTSRASR